MKKNLLSLFLLLSVCGFSQTGQYVAFTNISQSSDTLFLVYEWFDLDPIISVEIFLSFEGDDFTSVCLEEHSTSDGTGECVVSVLFPGWYQYYLTLEDGDQHFDSTSVGNVLVESSVNLSISEMSQFVENDDFRIFDLLGRVCKPEEIVYGEVYVLVFYSGRIQKIVFVE